MSVCRAGHLDGAFDVLRPNGKPNAGGVPNRMLVRRSKLAGPVRYDAHDATWRNYFYGAHVLHKNAAGTQSRKQLESMLIEQHFLNECNQWVDEVAAAENIVYTYKMRLRPDTLALSRISPLHEIDFGDPTSKKSRNRVILGPDTAYMTIGEDKFAVGLSADMEPYLSGRWRSYFERNPSSPDWMPKYNSTYKGWTSETFLGERMEKAGVTIQLDKRMRMTIVRPAGFVRSAAKGSTTDLHGRLRS